jgi:hypothetical protein
MAPFTVELLFLVLPAQVGSWPATEGGSDLKLQGINAGHEIVRRSMMYPNS